MNAILSTVISAIRSGIQSLEDPSLCDESNFNNRANAIDFIEFNIIDRIEGLQQNAEINDELDLLKQSAEKLKYRLKKIDTYLFIQLRDQIRNSSDASEVFNDIIRKYAGGYFNIKNGDDEPGYDNLDIFINGLLSQQFIPTATTERNPDMVFFQKTPARIIFQLAELAKLNRNDVFFDIGSGLGQVAIVVNLLSRAKATGIEFEPAYCNYAKECVAQLNLHDVEFINANAVNANYSGATVFFLYTPFEGKMFQAMLAILKKQAQKRRIKIFTYGPCTSYISPLPWLECINEIGDDVYKLYGFKSLDIPFNSE